MKITRIKTAESKSAEILGKAIQDHCLYFFRSPVILTLGGQEQVYPEGTALLYEGGVSRYFRRANSRELQDDLVQFRPSSAAKLYIGGLEFPLYMPVDVADEYTLATTIRNFSFHLKSAGKRRSELCELYMRLIFIALEEACNGLYVEISDIPRLNELREIRSEIYENPAIQLSVDMLCKRLGVGKTYFHKIYFAAFGITFRQDVIKSRISHACQLLEETKLSVSLVAEKCGYENESYFMKQFRQHMNCTPSQYRNKIY
jgi:AraC-like DNA-binding protein